MSVKSVHVHYCDLCGSQIPGGQGTHIFFCDLAKAINGASIDVVIRYADKTYTPDVCLNCANRVLDMAVKQLTNRIAKAQSREVEGI